VLYAYWLLGISVHFPLFEYAHQIVSLFAVPVYYSIFIQTGLLETLGYLNEPL
jgi:hypothetical protein